MHIAGLVFIDIAIIMIVARLFGRLAIKIGQPPVVGEIVAGIALGPSLLGLLPGDLDGRLAAVSQALDAFRKDGAWPAYDKVDAAQRKALADNFRALADTLDKVSQRLSVE